MKKTILGKAGSKPVEIGLPFRTLVMADTGGGKSYAVRRILEQTHGKTQQIIIDPEGEYSSLREKFDYLIAAPHGGDVEATPRYAATLARILREKRTSAVIDIFDLKMETRPRFVRLFFEALMNMPKKLNHPLMLVLEEAALFCPEGDKSESAAAVKDIAARGRKRGISLIAVTQRIAMIQKGMAAQLKNRLIGSATLDTDVKRIAFELGMTSAEAMKKLSVLKPGEFYAKGPQLTKLVTQVMVGRVITRHPQEGDSSYFAPPKPSKNLIKVIKSAFADLPAEAEREAKTTAELKKEVSILRRELTLAKKTQRPGGVDEKEVEQKIAVAVSRAQKEAEAHYAKQIRVLAGKSSMLLKIIDRAASRLNEAEGLRAWGLEKPEKAPGITKDNTKHNIKTKYAAAPIDAPKAMKISQAEMSGDEKPLPAGAIKILTALAVRHPLGYTLSQIGRAAKYRLKGSTFQEYMRVLKREEFIAENGKEFYVTDAGFERSGIEAGLAPVDHDEAMEFWKAKITSGESKLLSVIVDAGEDGISREDIGLEAAYSLKGSTFQEYLRGLKRCGLAIERDGVYVAGDILFPERA